MARARQSHERQGNSSSNTVSFGWREERKAKLLDLTRITTYTAADNAYSMNNLIACGYRIQEQCHFIWRKFGHLLTFNV